MMVQGLEIEVKDQSENIEFLEMKIKEMDMQYKKEIDGFKKYQEDASTQNPIIVHVRLGDYEHEKGIGILPNSYYLEALKIASYKLPIKTRILIKEETII